MGESNIPDQFWEVVQKRLGYSDEEMQIFREDPRNAKVLAAVPEMNSKTIVFEVIESKGCNSRHVVGTRFYFSGDGNLITKMAPSKVCAYILPILTQAIYGIQELWYAGADPNQLCFKRAGCFDVGVQCGGWGQVKVESRIMDREEAIKLFEDKK